MDYFLLHYEYEEYFESLPSDEDRAKLLMALFAYAKRREIIQTTGMAHAFFIALKNRIDKERHPSGPMHRSWKGGLTEYSRKARNSLEYRAWRKKVLERDGYACVVCNSKNNLHVHHIVPFSRDHSKRFVVDNGITLCKSCHNNEHKKGHIG